MIGHCYDATLASCLCLVPLSPSSRIWYWPMGGNALHYGRWLWACHCRNITCKLSA